MAVIKVCLGSSCYVRGNDKRLQFIEEYIKNNNKNAQIELIGCRCANLCAGGPNVYIDDQKHVFTTDEELIQILEAL